MKNIIILCTLVCISITTNAQATNNWIDFNKTYYKIKVAENGIYRINYNTLKEQGFPSNFTNGEQLNLIHQGEEVPLFVSNTNNWGEGEYIEFYGQQLDGQFDKRLYEKPEDQLHPYWSQFTDTAVYFLSVAEPSLKITAIENQFDNLPEKETHFTHTAVAHFHHGRSLGVPDARIVSDLYKEHGGINSHFARYGKGEGWLGHLYAANSPNIDKAVSILINTPAIFNEGTNAKITFKIVGLSSDTSVVNNHRVQVQANGQLLIEDEF